MGPPTCDGEGTCPLWPPWLRHWFWLKLVDDVCLKLMRTPYMASDVRYISQSVIMLTKEQNKTRDRKF